MTTDERLDLIFTTLTELRADVKADRSICLSRHQAVDDRIHGLHRVVKGNGSPGLEQKHETLTRRFDRFEAKVLAWVGVGTALGSILGPLAMEWARGGIVK